MPRHVNSFQHDIATSRNFSSDFLFPMGQQDKLAKKVKHICIVCIIANLILIFISQCYLLFEAKVTATNNLYFELETANANTLNKIILQKTTCTRQMRQLENKRLYYENKYRSWYVTMIGTISILEVFVDLPINILLVFAVYSKQRKLIIPWLFFNAFKIIATVVIVSLFVVYVIYGIDHFKSSIHLYDIAILNKSEDIQEHTNKEKRYIP